MNLDVRGVFRDAWSMWRRDRGVLVAIAGFFLFLPQLAGFLFLPGHVEIASKAAAQADVNAQAQAIVAFYSQNAPLIIATGLTTLFGALVILMLYVDREKRDVAGILLFALRRLPAYFLLSLVIDGMVRIGVATLVLIIPALYLAGRLLLAGVIMASEPRSGPFVAIAQSFRLTRGRGVILAGFAAIIVFGLLLAYPVIALGDVLDRAPLANPVSALIIDVVAALIIAAGMLGGILLRVALYRRIASSNGI